MMSQSDMLRPPLDRIQRAGLIVGVVGVVLCLLGAFLSPAQFFQSYLFAYLFWAGLALGCLSIMLLQHVSGGGWGLLIRRLLEAGARTLPLMLLLFVPLIFGMQQVYEWARPDVLASDEVLRQKSVYLNVPFFVIRTVIYFGVWIGLMYIWNRWSAEQDRTGNPALDHRLKMLGRVGLLLYFITMTFAAFDWGMSLEPHWFSTMYGIIFVIGQGLVTFAFMIVLVALLGDRRPLADLVTPQRFNDLGNLLLAFTMLWAYVSFSQYLIAWSGNLPEEVPWFLRRQSGGWQWIALALVVFQFILPFLLLLSRQNKRRIQVLGRVAILIVVMHMVEVFWLIVPAFHATGLRIHWLDLAAILGIGGLWLSVFVWQLKGMPIIPAHDSRLQDAAQH